MIRLFTGGFFIDKNHLPRVVIIDNFAQLFPIKIYINLLCENYYAHYFLQAAYMLMRRNCNYTTTS